MQARRIVCSDRCRHRLPTRLLGKDGVSVFVGAFMKRPNLTPRVQEALRQLLAGPQDMRD